MAERDMIIDDQGIRDEFWAQARLLGGDWAWDGPRYLRSDDGRILIVDVADFYGKDAAELRAAVADEIDRQMKECICAA